MAADILFFFKKWSIYTIIGDWQNQEKIDNIFNISVHLCVTFKIIDINTIIDMSIRFYSKIWLIF